MLKKIVLLLTLVFMDVPVLAQTVDTAWVRRYNGTGNSGDYANDIAVDAAGNVFVTGYSWGNIGAYDFVTIKYYPNGDTVWLRRYNGTGSYDDWAYAIALDVSGNVYVCGSSFRSGTGDTYSAMKYYPNGDTAWVRTGSSGRANDITVDASGNVCVTGRSRGSGSIDYFTTVKYYSNGDTAWAKRYNEPGKAGEGKAILADRSGNIYVSGYSCQASSPCNSDFVTIKYYSNGDTAWIRKYNGTSNSEDQAQAIGLDSSNNVYVTGYSTEAGTDCDVTTIKYYSDGDTAWLRRYDGSSNGTDSAFAIAIDVSGNVYVTGTSYNSGTGLDYITIKYFANGDTAWVRRYNGSGNSDDRASAITVDGSGSVYVTGISGGSGTGNDYATIKYKQNGDTAWVRRYNGPGNNQDGARALAVDSSGNVFVTGGSYGSGTYSDYATIRYMLFRTDTLFYFAYSPVDLIVTDPTGDSIGVSFNTIPNATYDTTVDKNSDGDKDDIVTIRNPLVGEYLVRIVAEPGADTGHYTLAIKLDGNEDHVVIAGAPVPPPGEADSVVYPVLEYLRGDPNRDGRQSVSDVIYCINYLFKGGPAPQPLTLADVNCDSHVSVSDVVYLVNYLFKGGDPPCS